MNNLLSKKSRRLSALLFLTLSSVMVQAKFGYQGFVGGMFLHGGYVQGREFTPSNGSMQRVAGLTTGIGGKLSVRLAPHWRIGTEGYATTSNYDNKGSFYSVGWGGLLNECIIPLKGCTPLFGVTIGGGSVHHLLMIDPVDNSMDNKESIHRKYAAMIVNPFIGVEFPVCSRISFSVKLDYMLNVTSGHEPDFATGPRLYFGILFGR